MLPEMDKQGKICRRVVLVPLPFQGHINPMLQLGSLLYSKGFFVTVVHTQYNSPDPCCHPEFDFRPIPDGLSDDEIDSGNLVVLISAINDKLELAFQDCLLKMMLEQDSQNGIACIIYDELMYFFEAVVNHLKLPSVVLRPISAATYNSRVAILQLKEQGYIPFSDAISEDLVTELGSLRFKDLPVSKFGTPDNFLQMMANACYVKRSSAVIWNTMDFLE